MRGPRACRYCPAAGCSTGRSAGRVLVSCLAKGKGDKVLTVCSNTSEDTQFPTITPFPRLVSAREEHQRPAARHRDSARWAEARLPPAIPHLAKSARRVSVPHVALADLAWSRSRVGGRPNEPGLGRAANQDEGPRPRNQ